MKFWRTHVSVPARRSRSSQKHSRSRRSVSGHHRSHRPRTRQRSPANSRNRNRPSQRWSSSPRIPIHSPKKSIMPSIFNLIKDKNAASSPKGDPETPRASPPVKGPNPALFQSETFIFQVQTSNGKWFHYPPGAEIKISEAYKKGKEKVQVPVLVGPDSRKEVHSIQFPSMKQMCMPENSKSRPVRMALDLMLADKWGGNAAHEARIPPSLGQDPPNTPTNPNMYFPLFPSSAPLSIASLNNEKTLRVAFKDEKVNMARAKRFQVLLERARKVGAKKLVTEIEHAFILCQHVEKLYGGLDGAALERAVRDCKQNGMKGPLVTGAKSRMSEMRVSNIRHSSWAKVMKAGCADFSGFSATALREMERDITGRDAKTTEDADLLRARALRVDRTLRDLEGRAKKQSAIAPLTPKNNASASPRQHMMELNVSNTPPHWVSTASDAKGSDMITPVLKSSSTFQIFRNVLETDKPTELNKGKDVKEKGEYSSLDLVGVWRLENTTVWQRYDKERNALRTLFKQRNIKAPHFFMRRRLYDSVRDLPGYKQMYEDVNETYLIHGTGPDAILPIIRNGMSPPHWECKALFGKGIYFAEDSCKNDQYGVGDWKLGSHPELHKLLFPPDRTDFEFPKPPYKAYYILLCRVIMGYFVTVTCTNANDRSMINNFNEGHPIFADNTERELAMIPGIDNPSMRYHCLVAKKGGAIVRFREFCQFHGSRVYPEYLMCYTRR